MASNITPAEHKVHHESFDVFFSDFKKSIINNDVEQLIDVINFPLKVRGELDSSPVAEVFPSAAPRFLSEYLSEPIFIIEGDQMIETTLAEMAARPESASPIESGFEWRGMLFKKRDGRWYLSEVLTYDHLVESIQ